MDKLIRNYYKNKLQHLQNTYPFYIHNSCNILQENQILDLFEHSHILQKLFLSKKLLKVRIIWTAKYLFSD